MRRLLLAVLALVVSAGCNFDLSAGAEARGQWQRQYTVARGGTLDLRNTNGVVRVEVTDADAIDVRADKVVRAATDQAARDALAAFEIRESVSADRITIDSSVRGSGINFNMQRRVEYVVRVPRWLNVEVETTNGAIELGGAPLAGRFEAETTNGSIHATGLENTAAASTTNGAIELQVSKIGENGITCETTNGAISLAVPADANAQLSARVTNGGISTDGLALTVSEQSRRRLDAALGRGGPSIRLETTNGGIEVRGVKAAATN